MNLDTYKEGINDDNWDEILNNKVLSQIYLYYLLLDHNKSTNDLRSNSNMTSFILTRVNSIVDKNKLDYYRSSEKIQTTIWNALLDILENDFSNFKKLQTEDQLNILQNLICIHFSSHIQRQTSLNIAKYGFEFIKNYENGINKYNENLKKENNELIFVNDEDLKKELIEFDIETIEYSLRRHLKEMEIDTNMINRSIRRFNLYYNYKDIITENFILSLSESFVRELTTKNIKDTPFQRKLLLEIKEKKIKKLSDLKLRISEYLENQIPIFNFNRFQALNKTINKHKSLLKISTHQEYDNSLSNLYQNTEKFIVEDLSGGNNLSIEETLLLKANKLLIELDEKIDSIIKIQKMPKASSNEKKKLMEELRRNKKEKKDSLK